MLNNSEQSRWGILYCPQEGSWRSRRRWARIRARLDAIKQPYDFVQSEGPGSIERLAAMMAANGYRLIVVVGGDAALNSALNGLIEAVPDPKERPALAVIPNGLINGFAHFWRLNESEPESCVDRLVRGRLRKVDVGVADLVAPDGKKERRYFLNCVNLGMAAAMVKLRRRYQHFWGGLGLLRELSSALMLVWHRHSARVRFTTGVETFEQRITTLCVGSCTGYGQTPSAVPYNGMLDISAVRRPRLFEAFAGLWHLLRGRFLSQQKSVSVWRTRHVKFFQVGQGTVTIDSRPIRHRVSTMDVEVLRESQPFWVPVD